MSETLVLDASVGLRIVQDDEAGHEEARECLARALAQGWDVVAPDLYLYEVGNVIARSRTKSHRAERLLEAYGLVEVVRPSADALQRALAIAGDGKPSFYDAAYVALAEDVNGTLWTEDREVLKRYAGRTASTRELARRLG